MKSGVLILSYIIFVLPVGSVLKKVSGKVSTLEVVDL
jgi:hypothetical protein